MKYRTQKGVALVVAVLVVAIAAVLATGLVDKLNLDIRRTENLLHSEQAYVYAQGAEIIAVAALYRDRQNNKFDSLDEEWAMETPPFPVEGGAIVGRLYDLQACFNLNNLQDSKAANYAEDLQRFNRLMYTLDIPPAAGNALVDWLDQDMETTPPAGAEDDWYMGLTPAFRTANGPLTSPSELRMIRGFAREEAADGSGPINNFAIIEPYVCTLPIPTAININTAKKEVLKSLSADMTDADVNKILERRDGNPEDVADDQPFETLDEFKNFMHTQVNKPNFSIQNLSVASNYFLLDATAQTGNNRSRLFSIIQRDDNGKCHVIARSQGVW